MKRVSKIAVMTALFCTTFLSTFASGGPGGGQGNGNGNGNANAPSQINVIVEGVVFVQVNRVMVQGTDGGVYEAVNGAHLLSNGLIQVGQTVTFLRVGGPGGSGEVTIIII